VGLFKTKAQKRADLYLELANVIVSSMESNTVLFTSYHDAMMQKIYEPILSLSMLLVASFCGDPDASLEMVPTFQKQVLQHPISEADYNAMNNRINDYYNQYRTSAIQIEAEGGDYVEKSIERMAAQTESFLNIEHTDDTSSVLVDYIKQFISIAKSDIRGR